MLSMGVLFLTSSMQGRDYDNVIFETKGSDFPSTKRLLYVAGFSYQNKGRSDAMVYFLGKNV